MRQQIRLLRLLPLILLTLSVFAWPVAAQTDVTRQTVAITYPLDQTVKVKLRGTTIQPRLDGDVEAKRTGRTGTRLKLSVRNLTRAAELGHIYTVYVLWAVSPEGIMDNLGEIRRGGSALTESKLEVTSRLSTFGLIVTAEPHSLVTRPSRVIIMENIRPVSPFSGEVAMFTLPFLGNSADEFRDRTLPGLPTNEDYDKTPVSLLGARRALALARYAGAERWSADSLKDAVAKLDDAEQAWQSRVAEAEVDLDARSAIRLALRAEDEARTAKNAFDSRERERKSARELETTEQRATTEKGRADTAEARIRELERELDQVKDRLTQSENDLDQAKSQISFLKPENERLREESRRFGQERDDAKSRADRLEGELAAARSGNINNPNPNGGFPTNDGSGVGNNGGNGGNTGTGGFPTERPRNTGNGGSGNDNGNSGNDFPNDDGNNGTGGGNVPTPAERDAAIQAFRRSLEQFGPVRDSARGPVLVFQESVWTKTTSKTLTPAAGVQMESLAALLASNPEYQISIASFTDNVGNAAALKNLTQGRAQFLGDRFSFAGVDPTRITANGYGAAQPIAPNTAKTRARNRRTEITFIYAPVN